MLTARTGKCMIGSWIDPYLHIIAMTQALAYFFLRCLIAVFIELRDMQYQRAVQMMRFVERIFNANTVITDGDIGIGAAG